MAAVCCGRDREILAKRAAGMGIETIRAKFFEIGCQKNGGSFVKSSGSRRNINAGKEEYYDVSTQFDRKLAGL